MPGLRHPLILVAFAIVSVAAVLVTLSYDPGITVATFFVLGGMWAAVAISGARAIPYVAVFGVLGFLFSLVPAVTHASAGFFGGWV